jgi:hypothetical protein
MGRGMQGEMKRILTLVATDVTARSEMIQGRRNRRNRAAAVDEDDERGRRLQSSGVRFLLPDEVVVDAGSTGHDGGA